MFYPVLILITFGTTSTTDEKTQIIRDTIESENKTLSLGAVYDEAQLPHPYAFLCSKAKKLVTTQDGQGTLKKKWADGFKDLEKIYYFKNYKVWRESIIYWLTTLITNLHNEIHEGEELGFWFVCGDLSEIKQCNEFIFEIIDDNNIENLKAPWFGKYNGDKFISEIKMPILQDVDNKISLHIKKAIHSASKENYVWFQDSRYALFWDITFPDPSPAGLIRLKVSNWDWYVSNRVDEGKNTNRSILEKYFQNWPKIIVAYKHPDGSGGIIFDNDIILSLSGYQRRKEIVKEWIKSLGSYYLENNDLVNSMEIISKVCVRAADDPKKGGCVILLKENKNPSDYFIKMGHEIQFQEPFHVNQDREEDIIHLLSMDGATCVWKENGNWEIGFRFLLQSDPKQPLMRALRKKTNDEKKCDLSGTGSRRWSGAIAACHDCVDMALIISQDGDILVFKKILQTNGKMAVMMKKSEKISSLDNENTEEVHNDQAWKVFIVED